MNNIGVNIIYKNSKLETVCDKTYTLEEYTKMMRADILRLISDVEDLIYKMNGGKPRMEWTDDSWVAFCCIKHKLLDKAGEIERLPNNLVTLEGCTQKNTDDEDLSEFVARVFNKENR